MHEGYISCPRVLHTRADFFYDACAIAHVKRLYV